jgi:hypothetical protein
VFEEPFKIIENYAGNSGNFQLVISNNSGYYPTQLQDSF